MTRERRIGRASVALLAALLTGTISAAGCRGDNANGGAADRGAEPGSRAVANASARDTAPPPAAPEGGKERAPGCTPRRLRALFIGTSLTAGLGLEPDQAYPALIQRMADSAGYAVEVVNAGVSGETSAAALRRADWILRAPADLVLLETGANDGLRALDPTDTRENVRAILAKARQAHPAAQLLLVQMEAPPNLGPAYTAAFREMFPEVAREAGATLVPFLLEGVAGAAALNQGDGIHPNVAGERRVAANVWPSVERALRALDPCVGRD